MTGGGAMVEILETFTGYPDGPEGAERRFEAGDRPAGLSAEYEDLLIGKGHARRIRKAATASTGAAADRP